MSLSHNSKIVTEGLVFAYDMNNIKSYKGPVIQNIIRQIANPTLTNTGISITSGIENTYIPELGRMNVKYSIIQNDYPATSTQCCPSPFSFGNGYNVLPSTLYTYAIVYKVESEYTNPNFMYRYEHETSGGLKTTEGGVHNNSRRIHLGNGWYWAWGTFTTHPTTTWLNYMGFFYYRYSTVPDKVYVAKILLAQGDYSNLHPRYWPDVNTGRSNTFKNIVNDTIINGNVSYNNDGSVYFNGPSSFDYLYATEPWSHVPNNSFSYEVWFKHNVDNNYDKIIVGKPGGHIGLMTIGNTQYFRLRDSSGWRDITVSETYDTWYHLVGTYSVGVGSSFYRNGDLIGSNLFTSALNNYGTTLHIGGNVGWNSNYSHNARINVVKVYNRSLSPSEIRQNYNALKGRYGL